MKVKLYAIRDCKVGIFYPPTIFDNDSAAIRVFGDLVLRDKDNPISIHRDDFALYFIGEMDKEHGILVPSDPTIIASGSDFVNKE